VWDVAVAKEAAKITVPDHRNVLSAIFSPDGQTLFTMDWKVTMNWKDSKIRIRHWKMPVGKQDQEWLVPSYEGWLPHLLAPDGKTLVRAQPDGVIIAYDVDSQRERVFRDRENQPVSLALSPDARILASRRWAQSSALRLWELATGKEICQIKGHQNAAAEIAWSPDGRLLASGERRRYPDQPIADQTIRLWDSATGKEVARFGGFRTDVMALSFSQDGKRLAAGLRDGTILTYEVADPRLLPPRRTSDDELESCWSDLGSDNAGKAHQALWSLVATPKHSVPLLGARLKPVERVDEATIARWIVDLDNKTFAIRQNAHNALAKSGEQIHATVRKAMKGNVTLETRRRLEQILKTADVPSVETLRAIRVIMALERIGSREAQGVLETLAGGAAGARETEEAKATLERLRPAIKEH
jgi:dipeptidyl aminopeptidase/acylaminoacyl peptidase